MSIIPRFVSPFRSPITRAVEEMWHDMAQMERSFFAPTSRFIRGNEHGSEVSKILFFLIFSWKIPHFIHNNSIRNPKQSKFNDLPFLSFLGLMKEPGIWLIQCSHKCWRQKEPRFRSYTKIGIISCAGKIITVFSNCIQQKTENSGPEAIYSALEVKKTNLYPLCTDNQLVFQLFFKNLTNFHSFSGSKRFE